MATTEEEMLIMVALEEETNMEAAREADEQMNMEGAEETSNGDTEKETRPHGITRLGGDEFARYFYLD
jgi:hypothetical protein